MQTGPTSCALAIALASGCSGAPAAWDLPVPGEPTTAIEHTERPTAPEPPAAGLSPLESASPFVQVEVPGHGTAVVSLPLGATRRRPVIVAAHGAGDRPEWQCETWRRLVKDRGFVLCPRGFPINRYLPEAERGYFYPDHHELGREITLALEALAKAYPDYVDLEAPSYAGFSQGAIMGALLLPVHPARFARAALIEGGYGFFQEWSVPVAQIFKSHGAERVLLACGNPRCAEQARVTAGYMTRVGLDARVVHAEGAGHTYVGAMEREVEKELGWVIEGDARW